jgi:hypothetical protein
MMPMTGKTNVRPVDGPAVTDRNKHQAEDENDVTQKWTVLAQALSPHRADSASRTHHEPPKGASTKEAQRAGVVCHFSCRST